MLHWHIDVYCAVPLLHAALALVRKIRFFKAECKSETKFHVSIGHTTTLATAVFFGARELAARAHADAALLLAEVPLPAAAGHPATPDALIRSPPDWAYDWAERHIWQDTLASPPPRPKAATSGAVGKSTPVAEGMSKAPTDEHDSAAVSEWQWCALLFEAPLFCPAGSRLIASHLDVDVHAATCRLAFHGRISEPLASADIHELSRCNIYKDKTKQGLCDRLEDPESGSGSAGITIIGKSLFKKESDMSLFVGLRVHTRAGQVGTIVASFGKGGKFKAHFPTPNIIDPLFIEASGDATSARLERGRGKDAASAAAGVPVPPSPPLRPGDAIFLRYRKRLFQAPSSAAGTSKPVSRLQQI
jgi:selenocysteine-specific elongation factor